MQWSDAPGAGFTTTEPWLPLAEDFAAVNVRCQLGDPSSLLSFYRRVIWYRKRSDALLRGTYRPLDGPADTFVYLREHRDHRLLVALNFGEEARRIGLPSPGSGRIELSTDPQSAGAVTGSVDLGPVEGLVIAL